MEEDEYKIGKDGLLEQHKNKPSQGIRLQPYQFKKGQSGNPNGRPPGKSLKERAKAMLNAMNEEEEQAFLEGLDKRVVWEMAEGKPQQDTKIDGSLDVKITELAKIQQATQTILNEQDTTTSEKPL